MVTFGLPDDIYLPLTRCACGAEFKAMELTLSCEPDDVTTMRCCGRRLIWAARINVIDVDSGEVLTDSIERSAGDEDRSAASDRSSQMLTSKGDRKR